MTLQQVAEYAGVSASTVCRVVNLMPGTTAETTDTVHRAIKALAYVPAARRRGAGRLSGLRRVKPKIAFVVLDLAGPRSVPKYDQLIRGVSAAATRHGLDLHISFMSDVKEAVQLLANSGFGGLILHGSCPPPELCRPLYAIPTIWLMGNPKRPTWGDQVMCDNEMVGHLAANYLLRKGCRNAVYFGLRSGWSLGVRALSFQQAVEDAGATATILSHPIANPESSHYEDLDAALAALVALYRKSPVTPDGLFIAEDWLVRLVYNALEPIGIRFGRKEGPQVVSCNNDRAHLIGLHPVPATIDIRAEATGAHAVDHLLQRIRGGGLDDRVRIMLDPELILPPAGDERDLG